MSWSLVHTRCGRIPCWTSWLQHLAFLHPVWVRVVAAEVVYILTLKRGSHLDIVSLNNSSSGQLTVMLKQTWTFLRYTKKCSETKGAHFQKSATKALKVLIWLFHFAGSYLVVGYFKLCALNPQLPQALKSSHPDVSFEHPLVSWSESLGLSALYPGRSNHPVSHACTYTKHLLIRLRKCQNVFVPWPEAWCIRIAAACGPWRDSILGPKFLFCPYLLPWWPVQERSWSSGAHALPLRVCVLPGKRVQRPQPGQRRHINFVFQTTSLNFILNYWKEGTTQEIL